MFFIYLYLVTDETTFFKNCEMPKKQLYIDASTRESHDYWKSDIVLDIFDKVVDEIRSVIIHGYLEEVMDA